jgi:quercetin dioxygenase-like cupin family protein
MRTLSDALNPVTMKKTTNFSEGSGDIKSFLDLEKSKVHVIIELIEYIPHAIVSRTILKKTTGNVAVSSFDAGEALEDKISPFDIYIQIIDGAAEVGISDKNYKLKLGEGIIIPAHTLHRFNAFQQFKMISTLIKSGYED